MIHIKSEYMKDTCTDRIWFQQGNRVVFIEIPDRTELTMEDMCNIMEKQINKLIN